MSSVYIRSRVEAGLLYVESRKKLINPLVSDMYGNAVSAKVLNEQEKDDVFITVFDGSALERWSPGNPVLYFLEAEDVRERFGFCELRTFGNTDILLNGERCYLKGYIRGITAHEHPNMTGGTLKDAAVKNIRQAKKYGFNLVRFHSTVPTMDFVEAADEEGLFIHMEIGFAYEYDENGNKKSLAMDNANWRETILRFRNHPSVAIFCIGNEMHNSGHQPGVYALCDTGRKLAPGKLIMDNSGWGEYDRPTADIFSQHIAYYFPYKHHKDMFITDDCWRINGSTYDSPLLDSGKTSSATAEIRREAVPLRPVLAHEALHYIDIPDYEALSKKFDDFCAKVGKEYLEVNGIQKPRFMTELPELIRRKGLTGKLPDYIKGSQVFKLMAFKTYIERMRDSAICGYEMLQLADCLKYENKNGILDCFDDDKFFDPKWMLSINGDAVLLGCFEKETFFEDEQVNMVLKISNFLPDPRIRGDVKVQVDGETVYTGKDFSLVGGLQKLAEIALRFDAKNKARKSVVTAEFVSGSISLRNSWDIWLYPHAEIKNVPVCRLMNQELAEWVNISGKKADENVIFTDRFNEKVFDDLNSGRHVVLLYHRDNDGQDYYLPGALERFKPCIWDRGSNLGGVILNPVLNDALASERYFDKNLQVLLEAGYKVCLDDFPVAVTEHIFGIDKPVRDRMKGLIHGVKDFIDTDTFRNFSHLFTVKVGNGQLTVCTMHPADSWYSDPVRDNFFAAIFNNLGEFESDKEISITELKDYLIRTTAAGIRREDVMNHFWEIDNKPVEDKLYWEEVKIDMRKHK
ncbi:MAG: hypothetical protein IJC27_08350 [Lentisphaeria bacterium]|nr:hypothetical protein [Lentisphaeria bacterium]